MKERLMRSTSSQPRVAAPAVLTKAFLRAGRFLGMPQRALAKIVGTSEASISRLTSGRHVDPASKEGELALLFVRMYRSLDALFGCDTAQCRRWFDAENAHLGRRPRELAETATGLVHVTEYLDAMRGKI